MSHAKHKKAERHAYLNALCRTVPYTIVEAVLANPTDAATRSTEVEGTVLNANIVGLTSLCEILAASGNQGLGQLTDLLNRLFTRLLEEALFPYEGYAIQFGGDALTAIFRGKDNALRAAASAFAAQRIVDETTSSHALLLRVGLATGRVRLPVLGDLIQRTAIVGGPVAHLAVRLQESTAPGTILVDPSTAGALAGAVRFASLGTTGGVAEDLLRSPERKPMAELASRIEDRVEEKIALLEPFVAPPLAARLKSTPEGWRIDGELRNVVVVFADVGGFAPDITPETMLDLSRSFLRAYRKYGGVVVRVDLSEHGQRAMVLFGLHMPSDNDAERALLAALEATARIKGYASVVGDGLRFQTGVHAGQVYFGAFGSDWRHDITVVGDTVNTAARVCQEAQSFEVLATEAVYESIAGEFQHSDRAPVRVHGRTESVNVKAIHSPSEAIAHYLQTRGKQRLLAGRSADTARLKSLVDSSWEGTGHAVGISGGTGTGKSALLSQVVDDWTRRGGLGLLGRCRYATATQPLAPIVAMFSAFLGLTRAGDDTDRRARIRAGLDPFALSDGAPELMALLQPVRRPDGAQEALVDLADSHARERVLASIVEFVNRRVEQERVLYVLEDLHHADSLTLDLAARVCSIGRDRPFLFVATYRPDDLVTRFRRGLDHEIRIDNLTESQAGALLLHELRATSVEPGILAFIQRRTGGNPSHLVDVIRFLRDRELLHVRAGMVVLPKGGIQLLDDVVPNTAASAALAQLDGLGEVERRLVRAASVIGKTFSRELLESVTGTDLDPSLVGWAMDNLEAKSVISTEFTTASERGYSFRDEVTRAAAYRTMPGDKRREIHRRIADAMEGRAATDAMEGRDAATLAVHRERAEQWSDAARWYERAARFALKAMLNSEVTHFYARWQRCVDEIPVAGRPSAEIRAQMDLIKLVALGRRRLPSQTLSQGRHVQTHHGALLGPKALRVVDYWLGCALAWMGQPEKARDRLVRVWENAEDRGMRCDAAIEIAQTFLQSPARPNVREWIDRATEAVGRDPTRSGRIELLDIALHDKPEELEASHKRAMKVHDDARKRGHLQLAALAAHRAATCDLHARKFERARESFEWALQLERALGDWSQFARELTGLGQAFLWEGRAAEAREPLERALRYAKEAEDQLGIAEATVHLGGAIGLTRDHAEGRVLCEQGAALASRLHLREAEVAAHVHLLEIALATNDSVHLPLYAARCRGDRLDHRTPLFRPKVEEMIARAAKAHR
jgi:adenylate cyclase